MTRVLKMRMNMPDGKALTWSLQNPKADLQLATIRTLISDMITESMILYNDVEPESFRDAYIYETNTIEIE